MYHTCLCAFFELWGAEPSLGKAEIIPNEPDADNAAEGKQYFNITAQAGF